MPITTTPQQFADRWTAGLSNASQKITDGVNAVSVAPSTKAVAAKAKMLANFTAKVNDGSWAAATQKVTLQDWQAAMLTKGVPRIGQGATAANSKMANFAQQLLPFEQTLQNTVNAMPNLTLVDSVARATAWINGMAKFKLK